MLQSGEVERITDRRTAALLGAFCLFLSTIEYMIPKPLPFIRIGIANFPLMLALDIFPLSAFVLLVGIKILGQALITGIALGFFCEYFTHGSQWYAALITRGTFSLRPRLKSEPSPLQNREFGPREYFRLRRQKCCRRLFSGRALCIAGLLVIPALFFNPDTVFRIVQFFFFFFWPGLREKNNPLITILVILGIAAFNLLVPYGRVIASLGIFKITSGALLAGIHRG